MQSRDQYSVKVINSKGETIVNTKPASHTVAFNAVVRLQPKYNKDCTITLFEADRVMDSFSGLKGF